MGDSLAETLKPDDPVVLDSSYRIGSKEDRRGIDQQILGIQQHLVEQVLAGFTATTFVLDPNSVPLAAGEGFCVSTAGGRFVTRADATALVFAKLPLGLATTAAAPGAVFCGALLGLLPASIANVGAGASSQLVYDPTSCRLLRNGSPGSSDIVAGACTTAGQVTLGNMHFGGGAGGGTSTGGGGDGFSFTFSATTTDADPGAGTLRLSGATFAATTSIFVDLLNSDGGDITAWLDSLDDLSGSIKGRVRVASKSDPSRWAVYTLSSVTTATGYRKLVVAYVTSSGTLPTVSSADTFLSFEAATDAFNPLQVIVEPTTARTFALSDSFKYIRSTSVSATAFTVPPHSSVAFPVGTQMSGIQGGSGQLSFVQGAGVTINTPETLKCRKQFSSWVLTATNVVDTWDLTGDLEFV